jgi:hypothetical protein
MACHGSLRLLEIVGPPLANSSEIGNRGNMMDEPKNGEPRQEAQESLIRILLLDVMTARERLSADQSQSNMRDLIRCAFAAAEGIVWIYSEHIAFTAKQLGELTPIEEMALSQMSYNVTPQGKVSEQSRHLPMTTAVRLATRIAKRINTELEATFDTSGWEQFRNAIFVRNRITHPKTRSDLLITDADVSTCLTALFWILEMAERAMTAANAAFADRTAEIWNVFERLERGDPETWRLYRSLLLRKDDEDRSI